MVKIGFYRRMENGSMKIVRRISVLTRLDKKDFSAFLISL